jgi:hypothetical protein
MSTGIARRIFASRRRALLTVLLGAAILALGGCGNLMSMIHGTGAVRPGEEAFGLGPRESQAGLYVARLEPDAPLRTRRLQSLRVVITDPAGQPVDGATITVDGGMPEHGHGLPTKPRVTRSFGNGAYAVEGVRFNMGGWWEFRLAISTAAGADSVTFNLDL